MSDSEKDEDTRKKDRLKELMKAATGVEDISEASNRASVEIKRDSKALNSAKEFLEDMEEDVGEEAETLDTEIVVPNQKDDMKLNSVFIGGPEPKPPTRRKVLHTQLADSLSSSREKYTGVDQRLNLMDPTQARKQSPTGTRGKTGLSHRFFGANRVDKFNDASPIGESEEYIPKRSGVHRYHNAIVCLVMCIALMAATTLLSMKFMASRGPAPLPLDDSEPTTDIHQDPERLDALMARLIKSGAADQFTISAEGTAQYKAMDWLSNHDPAQLDASSDGLISRYALAVLFYSTSGRDPVNTNPMETDWTQHNFWMTGEGYCKWHGVKCVGDDDYFLTEGNGKVFQISLPSNNLRGSIPSEIEALSDLFSLNLKSNWLEGPLPHQFRFRNMRDLLLDDNMLNGTISMKMASMLELRTLSMAYNEFTGSIPDTIGAATQLRYVKLDGNQLTGTLPPSLSSLSRLETFQVAYNQLTGSLPDEFYEIKRLVNVSMSQNDISGMLSPNLSQLSHLEELHLTGNDLSGTIPDSFEKMALLGVLHLGDNNLSGTIPLTLGRRHRLKRLDLAENDLFGAMPQAICDLRSKGRLEHLAADCVVGKTTGMDLNNRMPGGGRRDLQSLKTHPMTPYRYQNEDDDGVILPTRAKGLRLEDNLDDVDPVRMPSRVQKLPQRQYADTEEITDDAIELYEDGVVCPCCTYCNLEEVAARIFDLEDEEEEEANEGFDAEDCEQRLQVSNFQSNEWPGLVGMGGEEAEMCLEENYPNLSVQFVQAGDPIPRNYRRDRVFVYLDEDGLVEVPPGVGRRRHLRKQDRN